jgi:hypothetical protein
MARLALYQYIVLKHPSKNEDGDTKVLIPEGSVLDKNEKTVASKLLRKLPEEEMDNLENIEIIVRPF